jgi:exonuclease SbcD
VHAHEIVSRDPFIVYPGNLQGRSVRECGEKGAVFVDVSGGRVEAVRRIATDRARWAEVVVDAAGYEDEASLMRAVEQAVRPHAKAAEGRMLAVRVSLAGATPLHARLIADPDLRDKTEGAAQRCGDEVWLERLRLATAAPARPTGEPGLSELDLAAALKESADDAALRGGLAALVGAVRAKMPGGLGEDLDVALDLDGVLAEAQALALGRAEEA